MSIWNERDIELIGGQKYLTEEASKKFYSEYKDYLQGVNLENVKFRLEDAENLVNYFKHQKDVIYSLTNEEKEKLLGIYKLTSKKDLFNFFINIPNILNKKMSIEELKWCIHSIDDDFSYYEAYFDLYRDIISNGLNKCIEKCTNYEDVLMYLETYKLYFNIPYKLNLEILYNLPISEIKIKEQRVKEFLNELKVHSDKYAFCDEIVSYFNKCILEEQEEIEKNKLTPKQKELVEYYEENYGKSAEVTIFDFLNLSGRLAGSEGTDFDTLVSNGILLSEKFDNFKFGKKEQKEFKIYFDLSANSNNNENLIDFSDLLNNKINSLDDLLNYLEFFKKYTYPIKPLNLMDIDEWIKANGFYDKNDEINDFYETIENDPDKYYYGKDIVNYFGKKIVKPVSQSEQFLSEQVEEEKFSILNRIKPMTTKKRKEVIDVSLAAVGIISCLYMTVVLKYNPVTVISNCVSTFKRFFTGNTNFSDLLGRLGNLTLYFSSIVGSFVFMKRVSDDKEDSVQENDDEEKKSLK